MSSWAAFGIKSCLINSLSILIHNQQTCLRKIDFFFKMPKIETYCKINLVGMCSHPIKTDCNVNQNSEEIWVNFIQGGIIVSCD